MLRIINLLISLLFSALLLGGCSIKSENSKNAHLLLYSELGKEFTQALVDAYNADYSDAETLDVTFELKEGVKPDLVLAERSKLIAWCSENKLQNFQCNAGDAVPNNCKDAKNCWYGVFYDPTVFLVNQPFARSIGQENIHSWADLLSGLKGCRIVMENLSDNDSTGNFLAALADKMGEEQALSYLGELHHFIPQYGKFPFTPIRMTAAGDADLAITRQSLIFKYLENKFPAYVVYPEEGAPVNLYGVGVFRESNTPTIGAAFLTWLLKDTSVKVISQIQNTGYQFLLSSGHDGERVEVEKLWLNQSYIMPERMDSLKKIWLSQVRFSQE